MLYPALAVLCLAVMTVFIVVEHKEKYVGAVILKGLASACFVALGFLAAEKCGNPAFAKLVKIGLLLGLAADILLNLRFVFKKLGKPVFLFGILVFLAGHILYLCALIPNCRHLLLALTAAVILTVLILLWIFSKIEAQMAFKIFGVFYIGAIMAMNCVAFCNLITDPSSAAAVFAVGAFSFLISDIVLILNTFGKESRFSLRVTNLSLYYVGQILIALSLMLIK